MTRKSWKKALTLATVGGAFLIQAGPCVSVSALISAVASSITAGGVVFIINRILSD